MYEIIKLPYYGIISRMPRILALEYYEWFIKSIDIRISMLSQSVRSTSEIYRDWTADKTIDSLQLLGVWFKANAKRRNVTDIELANFNQNLTPKQKTMVGAFDTVLTEKTLSLVYDVGMYCGEVLRNEIISANWQLYLPKQKNHIDYQHPVITGFKEERVCNPLMIVLNVASQYSWDNVDENYLYNRFVVWKDFQKI
jgi:hypothetical protein